MSRRWPVLLLIPALAGVVMVGSGAFVAPPGSGITGLVFIGPTCPVERIRPEPSCRDHPYVATIDFRTASTNRFVRSARSDVHGRFVTHLPPGVYVVAPRAERGIARPLRPRRTVRVAVHRFTTIRIDYDSGIRFATGGRR
ncbi:MAG: hypothetical protein ACJ76S_03185 [Solirubrobacteraceae bacterium]